VSYTKGKEKLLIMLLLEACEHAKSLLWAQNIKSSVIEQAINKAKKETGGQVYPQLKRRLGNSWSGELDSTDGLLIRDYFAGQAIIGISLSMGINKKYANFVQSTKEEPNQWSAITAYKIADAMIKERGKE